MASSINICDDSRRPAMGKVESLTAMKLLTRFLLYGRFDDFADESTAVWDPTFAEETIWNVQTLIRDVDSGGRLPRFINSLIDIKTHMSRMVTSNVRVALVLAMISKLPEHRSLALKTAVKFLQSSREFFLFVKYSMENPPVIVDNLFKNAIKKWYGADPYWLAQEVTENQGDFLGWSHKKVLEIADLRSDQNPSRAAVFHYVQHGGVPEFATEYSPIWHYFQDLELVNEHPTEVADVITSRKFIPSQINPAHLERRGILWEKLIPNMDIQEVLYWIPEFHECGFFHETNNKFHAPLVQTVVDRLRKSWSIHPCRFLINLQDIVNSCLDRSPEKPEVVTEVIEEMKEQMFRSFDTIPITNLKIKIVIDCYDLDDRRCGPLDLVDAKVAAATVAYSIKRAALTPTVHSFQGLQPVELHSDDFNDTLHAIAKQSCHKFNPEALKQFLKDNTEDDLFVILGYQTSHHQYLDVIEDIAIKNRGRTRYAFVNLGPIDDPSLDSNYIDHLDNRKSNLLVTSGFTELTCEQILGFGKYL